MQLETGKGKHGMVGTLTAIIREEGAALAGCTEVWFHRYSWKHRNVQ